MYLSLSLSLSLSIYIYIYISTYIHIYICIYILSGGPLPGGQQPAALHLRGRALPPLAGAGQHGRAYNTDINM